jgi:hypothetical protein
LVVDDIDVTVFGPGPPDDHLCRATAGSIVLLHHSSPYAVDLRISGPCSVHMLTMADAFCELERLCFLRKAVMVRGEGAGFAG